MYVEDSKFPLFCKVDFGGVYLHSNAACKLLILQSCDRAQLKELYILYNLVNNIYAYADTKALKLKVKKRELSIDLGSTMRHELLRKL